TLAERGADTLRFGPMKPVGLVIPETGEQPYAVVQLRMENRHGTAYNMVGFQTKLKWPEQTRVFRLIPGLEDAAFLRYGSLHRNTYLCTPAVADPFLRLIAKPNVILAGQISGVEGYVESTAMGWLAGVNAARLISGKPPVVPPAETAHGGLADHVTRSSPSSFQPSNINFGLLPALRSKIRNRRLRYEAISARALEAWRTFLAGLETDDRGPA
ncbi:MAG: methylenetetrahydrofolate--tRNA-(uracil(54)-C(5))-methyltransferase (FADH(2)-oxidizing) TrmFO, partial [Thermodesulfobacteriota bacterium]